MIKRILTSNLIRSQKSLLTLTSRACLSSENGKSELSASEAKLVNILKNKFPRASLIKVQDISGGCGSMYDVFVESTEFKDLRLVKRHQMITQALKEEIKLMHGLTIYATTPEESK